MDYEHLYKALLDDVHGLRADLRSMQLGASDREAPAFGDAEEMTRDILDRADILHRAEERKNNAAT